MRQPLNILFITAHLPSIGVHAGGGRMFHLIEGLSEYHHISLLSYIAREEDREHIPAIEKFCRKVEVILRGHNPEVYNPFCLKPRRLLVEYLNPRMAEAVARELATRAYDLCQVEYLESAAVLPAAMTIPLVLSHLEVQYAGLFRAASLQTPLMLAWWGKVFRGLTMLNYEINTLRKFDAILTMCEEDAKAILRFSPDLPMGVSPMGVDTEYFQPDEQQPEPESMIYTGYYEHHPNEDAVVYFVKEIFPLIRRKIPKAKFYIVGSHPSEAVWELGRLDNVVVTGRVPDLRPWLARAAVFVAPIRLGTGMRGKIVEAMAMKRPVVGSSVALSGIEVTDGREAMIADEPVAFAEAVVRALTDVSLRDRIAQSGYELVRARYDWAVQVQAYHHLYCWLADQARRDGAPLDQGLVKENCPPKTSFRSPLIARVNKLLLPVGLLYLTPKTLWMLLKSAVRELRQARLRRTGRRPRTWGLPSLTFGLNSGRPYQWLSEREQMTAQSKSQGLQLSSLKEELHDTAVATAPFETQFGDPEQWHRSREGERDSGESAVEVEIRGAAQWDGLRARAAALDVRLSELRMRAVQLEQELNRHGNEHDHARTQARRASAGRD